MHMDPRIAEAELRAALTAAGQALKQPRITAARYRLIVAAATAGALSPDDKRVKAAQRLLAALDVLDDLGPGFGS